MKKITDFYWDLDNLIFQNTYKIFRIFAKNKFNEDFPEFPDDFNHMEEKDMVHLTKEEISSMFQAFNHAQELHNMKVDPVVLKIMSFNKKEGIKNHILTARPEYIKEQTLWSLEQNSIFKYMSRNDVHLLNYFENNNKNIKKEKHDVIIETQRGKSIFCDDSLAHLIGARESCEDIFLFGPKLSWLREEQVQKLDVVLYKHTKELYSNVKRLVHKNNYRAINVSV